MMKYKAGYGDSEWEQFIWSGQESLSDVTSDSGLEEGSGSCNHLGKSHPGKENRRALSGKLPEWQRNTEARGAEHSEQRKGGRRWGVATQGPVVLCSQVVLEEVKFQHKKVGWCPSTLLLIKRFVNCFLAPPPWLPRVLGITLLELLFSMLYNGELTWDHILISCRRKTRLWFFWFQNSDLLLMYILQHKGGRKGGGWWWVGKEMYPWFFPSKCDGYQNKTKKHLQVILIWSFTFCFLSLLFLWKEMLPCPVLWCWQWNRRKDFSKSQGTHILPLLFPSSLSWRTQQKRESLNNQTPSKVNWVFCHIAGP